MCWFPIDTNENSNELNYFELKYGKREVQTPQFFTPMGAPQTAGRLSQDNLIIDGVVLTFKLKFDAALILVLLLLLY